MAETAPPAAPEEQTLLVVRETRRSAGLFYLFFGMLLLGLPFLGRQRITITNQRFVIESGFWTKVRDDVEVFRIRDVVVTRSLWQRILGIGDVTVKSTFGLGQPEEIHVLRGVKDAVAVSEVIRGAWKKVAAPRTTTNVD